MEPKTSGPTSPGVQWMELALGLGSIRPESVCLTVTQDPLLGYPRGCLIPLSIRISASAVINNSLLGDGNISKARIYQMFLN